MIAMEEEVLSSLRGWLEAGAPDERAPRLGRDADAFLLGALYERGLLRDMRQKGAYYTPRPLAELLLSATLAGGRIGHRRVLDPACGCGVFLLAFAGALLAERGRAHREAIADQLHGIDIDPGAVALTRLALSHRLDLPLARVRNIRCADALLAGPSRAAPFDIIIGNPPFLGEEDNGHRIAEVRRRSAALARRIEPRGDYAYLFVHLSLDMLAEGGRLGLVLPAQMVSASGASGLRERLLSETALESLFFIEGGGPYAFAAAPGQHSLLLVVEKRAPGDQRPRVFHLRGGEIAESYLAVPQAAVPEGSPRASSAGERREPARGRGALRLSAPSDEEICARMERIGAPLAEGYAVHTGIQAGPDRLDRKALMRLAARGGAGAPCGDLSAGEGVFVLTNEEIERLGLSEAERALLRPFYYASELRGLWRPGTPRHRVLYLTPSTCPHLDALPALRRHFERFRPITEARRETRLGYRAHHHLQWPRVEEIFQAPKILSVRQTRRPRFVLALEPAYVDLAMNIIAPRKGSSSGRFSLRSLLLILGSKLVGHYLYHRGKRKGELLQIDKGPLDAIPLPPFSEALERRLAGLADLLADAPTEAHGGPHRPTSSVGEWGSEALVQIDQVLAECYDLDATPSA